MRAARPAVSLSPGRHAARPATFSAGRRNVLLLQGLMGPFFRRVGEALRREGYGVYKINFNGGDWLFWRLSGAIGYTGRLADWPEALECIVVERGITEVLLFGDCRPLHRAAIAVCRQLHIPVHVFEEGYIRPDWVTFEVGGVNGHSTLPRDPNYYREQAGRLPPPPEYPPLPSSFRRRALEGVAYNAADLLSRWHFRHWDNHRPWHPLTEGVGWLQRLARRREAARRTADLLATLESSGAPYMLFPLQLDADAQVRLHSSVGGMAQAIGTVIGSFAGHAPDELRLVIKEHPLDNGVTDWRALTARTAHEHGVADRVDYMEQGDIALVVRAARGLITVNSTTGTLALACGVPVITLGRAVYDMRDITFQGSLDAFWSDPGWPDAATFAAFRRVLIERCLVPGGFFSEEALDRLVRAALDRLERHGPLHLATASRSAGGLPQPHGSAARAFGSGG